MPEIDLATLATEYNKAAIAYDACKKTHNSLVDTINARQKTE